MLLFLLLKLLLSGGVIVSISAAVLQSNCNGNKMHFVPGILEIKYIPLISIFCFAFIGEI